MTEPVDLQDHLRLVGRLSGDGDVSFETFLREEGLDLLASYRSIEDVDARKAVKAFVQSLAKAGQEP